MVRRTYLALRLVLSALLAIGYLPAAQVTVSWTDGAVGNWNSGGNCSTLLLLAGGLGAAG